MMVRLGRGVITLGLALVVGGCIHKNIQKEVPVKETKEEDCFGSHGARLSPDGKLFEMIYSIGCGDEVSYESCIYDMSGEKNNSTYMFAVGTKLLCTRGMWDRKEGAWKKDTTYKKINLP